MTKLLTPSLPVSAQGKALQRRSAASREIGPITFLILAAIDELAPDDCHGAPIEAYVAAALAQPVDLAGIYITLKRLKTAQPTKLIDGKQRKLPSSAGHKVTVYQLTAAGRRKLEDAAPFYLSLGRVAQQVLAKAAQADPKNRSASGLTMPARSLSLTSKV